MVIPKINSGHGSDTRNILNLAIDLINMQGKSIQDLVAKGQLTPEQYGRLIEVINGNLKSGNVNINDLDEDTRKMFLELQGVDVNYVLGESNVTLKNTTFHKVGKNLVNHNNIRNGFIVHPTSGIETVNTDYSITEKITVIPGRDITFSSNVVHYGIFKSDGSRITGGNYPVTVNVPSGASYLLASFRIENKNSIQIEYGTRRTEFESYIEFIPNEFIENKEVNTEDIAVKSVTPPQTTFMSLGKNKFDKRGVTSPGIVNPVNGQIVNSQSYAASDFINGLPGERITISGTQLIPIRIAFYNEYKQYISGTTPPPSEIVYPEDSHYMRFSFNQGDEENIQVETGSISTSYEPYGYKFSDEIIGLNSDEETESKIILPEKLYGIVGEELNIYIDNVVDGKHEDYYVKVESSIGVLQNERWTFLPESSGTFNLTMVLYNKDYKVVSQDSTQVIVASKSTRSGVSKRALFIGSSSTESGIYTGELLNLFSEDVMNLSLIGTLGTGDNRHEGRGGWTYQMYNTSAESPFVFNGNFSFSQYISSNSLTRPDYVFFHLGINDVFSATSDAQTIARNQTAIDNMNAMISNIKTYNSNIKIGIILSYPVSDQDGFGKSYGTNYVAWRYKRNAFLAFREMLKELESRQDIFIVPAQTNVDNRNNMPTEKVPINSRNSIETIRQSNGVHIAQSGYYQFADAIYYAIKNLSD